MLVAGIDVGAELHHVAVVDEAETVVVKATSFVEDASAPPAGTLVVMEATGHYWQNLWFIRAFSRPVGLATVQ